MPVPHHDPLEFVAGDDWDIGGTLLRPDGSPLRPNRCDRRVDAARS